LPATIQGDKLVRIVDIGIDNDGIDPIEKLEVVYLVCN
jgi:hypothetical protein